MLTFKKKESNVIPKKAEKAPRKNASKAIDTGKVTEMAPPQGEISPEIEAAQAAVEQFEHMREEYEAMWSQFRSDYPEAYQLFTAIEEHKVNLQQHVLETKEVIREAGVSIGEFVCTPKFTKPHYDAEVMFDIMTKLLLHAAECAEVVSSALANAAEAGAELDAAEMIDHMNGVRKMVGMINELIRSGAVKGVSADQATLKVLMPRNPDISATFNDSYDRGGTPLTPAVEIPKIP